MNYNLKTSKIILDEIHKILKNQDRNKDTSEFAAFWDLDGTIIDGDITEGKHNHNSTIYKGLLQILIEENYLFNFKDHSGWKDFLRKYASIKNDQEKCLFPAKCLTEIHKDKVDQFDSRCYLELKKSLIHYFFKFSLDLMFSFKKLNIRNIIISASPEILVKQVFPFLPVLKHDLYGINYTNYKNKSDNIINYAEGKVTRLQSICEKYNLKPIFSAGNCPKSDGPMLNYVLAQGGQSLFIKNKAYYNNSFKNSWKYIEV